MACASIGTCEAQGGSFDFIALQMIEMQRRLEDGLGKEFILHPVVKNQGPPHSFTVRHVGKKYASFEQV